MACCTGSEIDLKEMRTEGQKEMGNILGPLMAAGIGQGATPFGGQLSAGSDQAQMAAMNTMMGIGGQGQYNQQPYPMYGFGGFGGGPVGPTGPVGPGVGSGPGPYASAGVGPSVGSSVGPSKPGEGPGPLASVYGPSAGSRVSPAPAAAVRAGSQAGVNTTVRHRGTPDSSVRAANKPGPGNQTQLFAQILPLISTIFDPYQSR